MPFLAGSRSYTERLGEPATERGLVEVAGGPRVGVQGAAVKRRGASFGHRGVGDHCVGVQLGIAGARAPMPKRRNLQAVAAEYTMPATPATRPGRVALDIPQRLLDRQVVRFADDRRQSPVTYTEQDRN
jgi:hypothetical protein